MLAIFSASHSQGAQQPFSIVITAAQATVKVGSEVRVDIQVKNTSDANIMLDSLGSPSYDMDVRDSKGQQAPETERMRKIHAPQDPSTRLEGSFVVPILPPGQSIQHYLSVDKFYDMSKLGKYTIQLEGTDHFTKKSVKSNTITVTLIQ
jgi:hypothetical protein